MNNDKLIQYISNEISDESEKKEIREWIQSSRENKQQFVHLKNAHALSRKSIGNINLDTEFLRLQRSITKPKLIALKSFIKYAAIVIISIGISWFAGVNLYKNNSISTQMNQVICPPGQITQVVLSDGTQVWLNADSKLSYPSVFTSKNRLVELEGEAYFDVTKNKKHPFYVNTDFLNVKVLGTSFNVEAYPDENFKTTLVEGQINIEDKAGKKLTEMTPGQMVNYTPKSQKLVLAEVDTRLYSSWKEGKMSFFDTPLEQIALKLERWYNVKINFQDEEIKKYRFSSTIQKSKPLDQILEIIKISASVDYKIKVNPEGKNEIILRKYQK